MTVHYEWDVEEYDQHGDIIEHWFQDSYADCVKWTTDHVTEDPLGYFEIVLVKTTDDERGWWYIPGTGELPENFADAGGAPFGKVPARFIKEVSDFR